MRLMEIIKAKDIKLRYKINFFLNPFLSYDGYIYVMFFYFDELKNFGKRSIFKIKIPFSKGVKYKSISF